MIDPIIPRFSNEDLAQIFETIANLLEIKGEIIYKILAYRKATDTLNNLGGDIYQYWRQGTLTDIPGIGKAIAEKINELLSTGRLEFLERLQAEVPISLVTLLEVPDVGPKKVALFWKSLGVTNLAELESAAKEGKLRMLPGMGEKSEARVVAGIEAIKRRSGRVALGKAWPYAQQLLVFLRSLPGVSAAEPAGSLRRMRPTVGDLDLVVAAADSGVVMDAFTQHPDILAVLARGETKTSVEFRNNLRSQLWVYPPERFGTGWLYATGSKDHNVRLRELAQKMGFSLSDASILREGRNELLCASEEEVYAALGLSWVPPELREDRGEVQAALENRLPNLVHVENIRAELHAHTRWTDGTLSLLELAEAARARGLGVLAITDHTASLGVTGGLSMESMRRQREEIAHAQQILGDSIRLLWGAEVEIKADGALDYEDNFLAEMDIVIASLHTSLRQPRDVVTERLLKAIRNPHVDVIGHPTGRMLPNREGADLDMEAIFNAAVESQTALEVNAHPSRLDLDAAYIRRAVESGIPLCINTDAHAASDLDLLHFGVATARRGWAAPENILNTWETDRLLRWLQRA
jgi:DNA polymerase (family 10)